MSEPSRRKFFKGVGKVVVVGAVGAALGSVGTQALALPPNNPVAQINAWNQIEGPDMIVWVDSSGNYYVKDTGVGSSPGSLVYDGLGQISGTVGITAYGNSLGAGTIDALTATGGLQEAINCLGAGGVVYIKAGFYNVSTPILIPYGLTFYFIGDGVPSFPRFGPTGTYTYATPTDGTQIRATTALNSLGGSTPTGMFTRALGATNNPKGSLYFYHMALMPAWGTTTSTTQMCCIVDNPTNATAAGSMHIVIDDVYFVPWGWTDAGTPIPTDRLNTQNFNSMCARLGGAGTSITIGRILTLGLGEGVALLYCDYIFIDSLFANCCYSGLSVNASGGTDIRTLSAYGVSTYALQSNGGSNGKMNILRIGKIFEESPGAAQTSIINLEANTDQLVSVDWVYIWYNSALVSVTTADSAHLIYPCHWWSASALNAGTNQELVYPLTTEPTATAFGGTISLPFGAASGPVSGAGVGSGGSIATPLTTVLYTANEPVDVTIAAGTGQTITTKDNNGNILDNAVATLSHRLLLANYTIKVTATGVGVTTVVQATIGNFQGIVGTTATAQVAVNYVALRRILLSNTAATSTMKSSDPVGNTMDASVPAPFYQYTLEAGMSVIFSTAAPVAGVSCTVVQQ